MSVLTGKQIIKMGLVENYDNNAIQPASVDVRLSNEFIKYNENIILKPDEEPSYKKFECNKIMIVPRGFTLKRPHYYYINKGIADKIVYGGVLGSTIEKIKVPKNMVAIYTGRSSLGRMFIQSHQTAGLCDSGWEGRITLEITAHDIPVVIYSGMRIGQIYFIKLDEETEGYKGKYQNQNTVIPTKIYEDFNKYNINQIKKDYLLNGLSLTEICNKYNIPVNELLNILAKENIDIKNVKVGRRLNRLIYDINDK